MAYNILHDCASIDEKALAFLQRNLLVKSTPPECPQFGCDKLMTLVKTRRGEECCFRCPSHKGQILCTDPFFENSKLSYKNIVELIFAWSFKTPVNNTSILTGLNERIVVQCFSFFRDVCSWWLDQIGGPGEVVEIDESLVAKRMYNVGRLLEHRWVFGGVERQTNKGFLQLDQDRSAGTLLDIIQNRIEDLLSTVTALLHTITLSTFP